MKLSIHVKFSRLSDVYKTFFATFLHKFAQGNAIIAPKTVHERVYNRIKLPVAFTLKVTPSIGDDLKKFLARKSSGQHLRTIWRKLARALCWRKRSGTHACLYLLHANFTTLSAQADARNRPAHIWRALKQA